LRIVPLLAAFEYAVSVPPSVLGLVFVWHQYGSLRAEHNEHADISVVPRNPAYQVLRLYFLNFPYRLCR